MLTGGALPHTTTANKKQSCQSITSGPELRGVSKIIDNSWPFQGWLAASNTYSRTERRKANISHPACIYSNFWKSTVASRTLGLKKGPRRHWQTSGKLTPRNATPAVQLLFSKTI